MLRYRFAVLVGLVLALSSVRTAKAQFGSLVEHLPHQPNVLLMFNFEKLLQSSMAKTEGWRGKHNELFDSGLIIVPPDASQVAIASQMDLELFNETWNASVMRLDFDCSIPRVAARFGGTVDEIESRSATALPGDTYVVQFGKNLVGITSPANRQRVAQWIRSVYAKSRPPLTDYLAEAEGYANEVGTPVIMALDLENVFPPAYVRESLNTLTSVKNQQVDLDKLATALASIRGVTLGITVRDKMFGKLKVDFKEDITLAKGFAKELLLEILDQRGAMINEFYDWKAEVKDKQVTIEGYLYQSGRQRLFSLLDTPPALHHALEERKQQNANGQGDDEQLVVLASQQYFQTLGSLLDDLRNKDAPSGSTPGSIGVWYERYARKIDRLPILNVDPQLVDFGGEVANQLRGAESAMKGIGAQQALRISEKPSTDVYNYGYAYGGRAGWGPYGAGGVGGFAYGYQWDPRASIRQESSERTRIRTQERIRGYGTANSIMQQLEADMAEARRQLTQKYQVEF